MLCNKIHIPSERPALSNLRLLTMIQILLFKLFKPRVSTCYLERWMQNGASLYDVRFWFYLHCERYHCFWDVLSGSYLLTIFLNYRNVKETTCGQPNRWEISVKQKWYFFLRNCTIKSVNKSNSEKLGYIWCRTILHSPEVSASYPSVRFIFAWIHQKIKLMSRTAAADMMKQEPGTVSRVRVKTVG